MPPKTTAETVSQWTLAIFSDLLARAEQIKIAVLVKKSNRRNRGRFPTFGANGNECRCREQEKSKFYGLHSFVFSEFSKLNSSPLPAVHPIALGYRLIGRSPLPTLNRALGRVRHAHAPSPARNNKKILNVNKNDQASTESTMGRSPRDSPHDGLPITTPPPSSSVRRKYMGSVRTLRMMLLKP